MRLMWIGGNHPRHLYYINRIRKQFPLAAAIVERRGHLIPRPPEGLDERDRRNFVRHFENREKAEAKYFGRQSLPDCPLIEVEANELNGSNSAAFLNSISPDVVLIFGSGLVKNALAVALPFHTINLHLGLSPRYRGSASLFWPFYFMEPTYAGSTFHYIVSEPDAGEIVHQVVPELDPDDGIHDVACKTVLASTAAAIQLIEKLERGDHLLGHVQRSTGKNFLSSDFAPEHLRVIYDLFDDRMVEHFLAGRLQCRRPRLVRQF